MNLAQVHFARSPASRPHRARPRRGSAVVFMILLMGVLIAGMVTSMAMLSGIQTQSAGVSLKRNAAFYAAEAGIQTAIWNMNHNPSPTAWLATLSAESGSSTGCPYTLSVLGAANWPASPITFVSVGSSGSFTTQATVTISNNVLAPGMAIGGGMSDSGTTSIDGNVQVVGAISHSGNLTLNTVTGQPPASLEGLSTINNSGRTFNIPGNLEFNGAITSSGTMNVSGDAQSGGAITKSGTWNVTGTTTSLSSPNLSFTAPTIDTASLITQAQANGTVMLGGTLTSPTFDFTASPNGIIYVNGNTILGGTVKVKGTGTLVIKGTLTTSVSLGSAATPLTMNLVTTSDMTNSSGVYLNGTLAVGGTYNKSGTTVVTGVIVVQNNITSAGAVTVHYPSSYTPPSFVHYTGSGGSGIQVANFSGATY